MNATADSWTSVPATKEVQEGGDFLELYIQSVVLMGGDTDRALYRKGQDIVQPMANTTKIMTCILALEGGRGEDTVKASPNAAFQPKVHLGVWEEKEYRLESPLYALILESYNDTTVMIVEHIGGSMEGFASMINEKAVGLGYGDTYFITSNGSDRAKADERGKGHTYSTAVSDLARIVRYYVTESPAGDEFSRMIQTQSHYFTDMAGRRSFSCYNHNAFLTTMEGVLSGETGFAGDAGYSYVGTVEDQERTHVIALLGCGWPPHKTYKWSDTRKLYTYGLEYFKMEDVFQEGTFTGVPVLRGLCWREGKGTVDQVELSMMLNPDDVCLTPLMGEGEGVRMVKKVPSILVAPVREGQQMGTVDCCLGEVLVKGSPVYTMQGVEKMNLRRATGHVPDLFLVRWEGGADPLVRTPGRGF